MSFSKLHISTWLFLLGTGPLLCNSEKGHAQQLPQYEINVNEGLLQSSVYAIHQDEKGFVWLGTGNGLNCFDGLRFRSFTYRLQDSTAKNFPGKIVHGNFIVGKPGQLFFLADDKLVEMNTVLETFKVLRQDAYKLHLATLMGFWEGQLLLLQKGKLEAIDTSTGNAKETLRISPLCQPVRAQKNLFWIENEKLYQYQSARRQVVSAPLPADIEICIPWSEEELLLAGKSGVFLYTIQDRHWKSFPGISPGNVKLAYSLGIRCAVIVNAQCGAVVLSQEGAHLQLQSLQRAGGIPEGCYLTAALRDRSGAVWLAQESGGIRVYALTETTFKGWQPPNNAEGENLMVKSLYNSPQGLLVGTFKRGFYLVRFPEQSFTKIGVPFQQQQQINSFIKKDSRDRLWSNAGGQLLQVNLAGKKVTAVGARALLTGTPRQEADLYSFCETAPGRYWLGTTEGVIAATETRAGTLTFSHLFLEEPGLRGFIYALEKAPDGDLYVGKSAGGFVRLHLNGAGQYTVSDSGLLATTIRHFHFDTLHKLVWIATDAGVVAYNPARKSYQVVDVRNGLSNQTVYAILSANNQRFWISTNGGINRIDCRFQGAQIAATTVTAYSVKDGLQSNEFNTGAYCNSGDSLFFFGGLEGVNSFRPAAHACNRHPPLAEIVEVLVNNKPYASDTVARALTYLPLTYQQNNLSFQFASLDFVRPKSNEFSCLLEGYNETWQPLGTSAGARYHDLPAGHYTLWLRASNNDKVWSQPEKKLSIFIRPPFWQTTVFKGILGLLALLVLFGVLRSLVRRGVQRRLREWEKLQAVNEERNRIHRDMHDDLGSGLSRISLLSELAAQKLIQEGNMPAHGRVQQIARIARGLTEKMGTIIWMLQPKNDTLDALTAYLQEYLYRTGEEMDLETEVHFPEGVPATPIQNAQRRCVLLVTQEAINNALKYAGASTLSLSLLLQAEKKGAFLFTFQDNGKGFDADALPERLGGGNGLKNMQERLEQMGGYFYLQTAPGAGCKIIYGWK